MRAFIGIWVRKRFKAISSKMVSPCLLPLWNWKLRKKESGLCCEGHSLPQSRLSRKSRLNLSTICWCLFSPWVHFFSYIHDYQLMSREWCDRAMHKEAFCLLVFSQSFLLCVSASVMQSMLPMNSCEEVGGLHYVTSSTRKPLQCIFWDPGVSDQPTLAVSLPDPFVYLPLLGRQLCTKAPGFLCPCWGSVLRPSCVSSTYFSQWAIPLSPPDS